MFANIRTNFSQALVEAMSIMPEDYGIHPEVEFALSIPYVLLDAKDARIEGISCNDRFDIVRKIKMEAEFAKLLVYMDGAEIKADVTFLSSVKMGKTIYTASFAIKNIWLHELRLNKCSANLIVSKPG
jgi:hypothetical protein